MYLLFFTILPTKILDTGLHSKDGQVHNALLSNFNLKSVKLLATIVILAAITVIGLNGNYAYAESGVAQISDITSQGGVGFDVLDPDGVESVVFISNTQGSTPAPTENISPLCPTPLEIPPGFFDWPESQGTNGPSTFEITDCSILPVTYSCEVFHPTSSSEGRMGTCTCIDNCDTPKRVVGGELLPIETTALLLAAAQSPVSWLTSLTIAALGIGAYVFTRNQNNLRNIKAILQDYLDRF